MNRRTYAVLAAMAVAAVVCLAPVAKSQPVGSPAVTGPAQNVDLNTPLVTNTLQGTGTNFYTPARPNLQWSGVTCTNLWTASSGSVTETWSIEGFDAATNAWYQIKAAAAVVFTEAAGLTHTLTVRPGVAVSSLATGNEAQNAVLPRVWRIKDVITAGAGGANSAVSNKIGCNYII